MKAKLFTKDFSLVVIGQIISLFGNAILRFALPLYLLRETNSPALFGIVSACSFLPMIVLSFIGGVLADRVNKRNIMVILDALTAIIVLVLTICLDIVPIVPLFIVVLMILYGISGTYQPTVQASIPALATAENILPAGAVINQIGALAGLLGPIIGGMLFGTFGIMPILIISIGCFAASSIMEIFIKIPYKKRIEQRGMIEIVRSDFNDSKNYLVKEKPTLLKIIIIVTFINLVLSSMITVGAPILIVDTLKLSDQLLGISQGALALGGLCGGILTAVFSKKLKLSSSHLLLLFASLCVAVMAIPLMLNAPSMVSYAVITGLGFVIMMAATIFSVQMIATVQIETPPELVGKIIALMMSMSMCAQPIGQALYGFAFERLADKNGIILLFAAIVSVVISLLSKRVFARI